MTRFSDMASHRISYSNTVPVTIPFWETDPRAKVCGILGCKSKPMKEKHCGCKYTSYITHIQVTVQCICFCYDCKLPTRVHYEHCYLSNNLKPLNNLRTDLPKPTPCLRPFPLRAFWGDWLFHEFSVHNLGTPYFESTNWEKTNP